MSHVSITPPSQTFQPAALSKARNGLHRLPVVGKFLASKNPVGAEGAADGELVRMTGPLGKLQAEDVRWDLIGTAHGGRRYRI